MRKYRLFDDYLLDVLKDPEEASHYLNAVAEENDTQLLVEALAMVAKAHGMTQMARKASVTRVGLYKTLSRRGHPELKTFLKLIAASGLQLSFKPLRAAA